MNCMVFEIVKVVSINLTMNGLKNIYQSCSMSSSSPAASLR
jgi:hypothetical protein